MKSLLMKFGGSVLSKEEMKAIRGGYEDSLPDDQSGGTCAYTTCTEGSPHTDSCSSQTHYNVSREAAIHGASGGGRWCCESCGSASWY